MAGSLGVEHRRGVIIVSVDPGSPLARQLPPGTILIEAGGRRIGTSDEFLARYDRHLSSGGFRGRNNGFPVTAIRPDGERVEVQF